MLYTRKATKKVFAPFKESSDPSFWYLPLKNLHKSLFKSDYTWSIGHLKIQILVGLEKSPTPSFVIPLLGITP